MTEKKHRVMQGCVLLAILVVLPTSGCISSAEAASNYEEMAILLELNPNITQIIAFGESKWVDGGDYIYPNSTFSDNVNVTGNLTVDGNTLVVDSVRNKVCLGPVGCTVNSDMTLHVFDRFMVQHPTAPGLWFSTDGTEDLWHMQITNGDMNWVESGVASGRFYMEQGGHNGFGAVTDPSAVIDAFGTDILIGKFRRNSNNKVGIEISNLDAGYYIGIDSNEDFIFTPNADLTSPHLTINNDTGEVDVTNNFTANFYYAEMHFHNDTTGNVTALDEDVWNNITAFDQEYSGQFLNGFSYSTSVLTVNVAGIYSADYSLTFAGTVNNKYHAAAGINGIEQLNTETHDRISTGSDILSASGTGFLQLSIGDEITLMMMNEDSGGDATIYSVNINLVRIGD